MRTLNLGILAHVDAGKTTLTERLLFTAGAIDHVGSVDAGTTQTDSLELERERGITIRSAVASFLVGDLAVNLVDTPGHPDFIAEVERVLGVLDGAVLVVSAVEGVQPQTPLLFRALQRLRVPTLIFVNKIDRAGADPDRVIERWRGGSRPARPDGGSGRPDGDGVLRAVRRGRRGSPGALAEVLAEHDEAILRAFVKDEATLTYAWPRAAAGRRRRARPSSTRCSSARPRAGSASTSSWPASTSSCRACSATRRRRSPAGCSRSSAPHRASASPMRACSPARSGRGSACASVAARRRRRPRSRCSPRPVHRAGTSSPQARWPRSAGLGAVRVGDAIGDPPPGDEATARFPRPALEAVVFARKPEEQGSLRAALGQLAEQDPLIDVRQDDTRHEIAVSLYGEVQKEVIQATLERDYGIAADFRETTTVCIERPAGVGEAEEVIHAKTHTNITGRSSPLSTNPFLATLGLRIEPAPFGSGIEFRSDVEARLVPLYLFKSVEAFLVQMELYVHEALDRGPGRLAGDRLPGHDDRQRLCRTRDVRGRLPPPDAAGPGDRPRSRRDVGVRTALGPRARDAGVDGAGRPRRRSGGSAAGSPASSRPRA